MKPNGLSLTPMLLLISFGLAGCGGGLVPAATSTAIESVAAPTATIEIPEPTTSPQIPCNIAFDSDRDGNREIYVMGSDGSDPINLTNHPAEDWGPVWSPDGSRIAFVSDRENDHGSVQCIYVMNADGSDVRPLTFDYYNDHPAWSPDGTQMVFSSGEDIFIASADGSGIPVNLTDSPEKDAWPVWSPDGVHIAWLSGNNDNWQIFIMKSDGSDKRQLTRSGQVNGVAWTVDGRLFTHWQNNEADCSNCLMDADGANLMDAGGKGEMQRYFPFWTVDGQRVEVASVDAFTGDYEIYLVSEIFPDIFLNLSNNPAQDVNPNWPGKCGPELK